VLCAFDLLEVNGEDVRPESIEDRKRRLAGPLRLPHNGIALNDTYRDDGAIICKRACALGCEGIVSKRLGSPYRAGRSVDKQVTPSVSPVACEWTMPLA
jgi:bifunctional non-homologous end joining protein LigD